MQDPSGVRSMATGCGRNFGDRRLRPLPNQTLKCPRCDSLSTKFCYYNNYNLSQPRHFCKNCRRYWTKGGVLRNVPVGGGSRKTKRAKPKNSANLHKESSACKSTSHSSSESSSLTATEASSSTIRQLSEPPSSSLIDQILSFPESRLFTSPNPKPNPTGFDSEILDLPPENFCLPSSTWNSGSFLPECGSFLPESSSFTSLITSTNPAILGFNFSDLPIRLQQQKLTSTDLTAGLMDQTVSVFDLPLQNRTSNGGLTSLDWQGNGGDSNLFDLPSTVDPGYWNQSHWGENDPSLYLP